MMTKHLILLLFIGLAWGQAEAERFVKGSQVNIEIDQNTIAIVETVKNSLAAQKS